MFQICKLGYILDCSNPSSIETIHIQKNQPYPNPASEFFNIKKFNANYITLNNSKGQEIKKQILHDEVSTIYRGDLQKGLYIYNLKDGKKLLKSGKIIFE